MTDEPVTPPRAAGGGSRPELPAHVTTPLLTQITQQSLDLDYRLVADRKAREAALGLPQAEPEQGTRSPLATWGWVGAVVAFGVLLSIAAVQTSRNAPVEELGRGALVKRLTDQRADLTAAQKRLTTLRTDIADLQDRRAQLQANAASARIGAAQVAGGTGYAVLSGPGVLVEATDGDSGDGSQVRDEDLALVANALWESGAEGIVVNGQRVTAVTAIRNSGTVIRVNRVAVQSPYRVEALGDPASLTQRFQNSPSAQVASAFAQEYGFDLQVSPLQTVSLPAATEPVLRSVTTTSGTSGRERSAR